MKEIPQQAYMAEFKELVVKRVKDRQAIPSVEKELGLNDQTLRNWIKAAATGKLNGSGRQKTSNCHFYEYEPPRLLEQIEVDSTNLEQEIMTMLKEVTT